MNATTAVTPAAKPKLLDSMRNALRVRHLARSTEKAYVYWARRFILHHNKRHPLDMGKQEVEAFLTHLAVDQHVSASTQNQAFSALLFLYRVVLERDFGWLEDVVRARRPKRIPAVFTHAESMAILNRLRGVNWLVCKLLYGSGLRGIEALRLRVKDLDFERLQITIRDAKGQKDRITILPKTVVDPLKKQPRTRALVSREGRSQRLRRCGVARRLGPQVPECAAGVGLAIRVPSGQTVDRPAERRVAPTPPRSLLRPACRAAGDARSAHQQTRWPAHLPPFLCDAAP